MYQGPECSANINTAEEYLLGKPVKEQKQEDKKHFTPIFQESYSNPKNELFTKIHEDPMLIMKKEEVRQRKDIESNPYKMKMLMKEIEESMQGRLDKNEKKKEKKHKKHKKEKKEKKEKKDKHHNEKHFKKDKKHRRSTSRGSRSSSSSDSKSRSISLSKSKDKHRESLDHRESRDHRDHHRDRDHRDNRDDSPVNARAEKLSFTTPSYASRLNTGSSYGLVDKFGKKLNVETPKIRDYKPDESLYREKMKNLEKEKELRRKKTGKTLFICLLIYLL